MIPQPVTPREPPRLLVIDDDPSMCRLIADIGQAAGFSVVSLTDPDRLEAAIDDSLAAITLDLSMPKTDGVEVLRRLAAVSTRARVILLSGVDATLLESVFNLGRDEGLKMAGHLAKPVRARDLIALLQSTVGEPGPARAAGSAPPPTPADIRDAIDGGRFHVHLQPQVRLSDGSCAGLEALVRWRHPTLGLLYPDSFIPIIEQEGWGLDLTEQVLSLTLERCRSLCGRLSPWPTISVNLSADALTDLRFPDRVGQLLDRFGASPGHLAFELTETALASEPVSALDILSRLRLKGIRLSIDDFGIGYSSLQQLQRLPFTELKIDKQFTLDMATRPAAAAIVRSTIALAKDLGLQVLAEGVETEGAWWQLRQLGCDLAQGYLIARPMEPERVPGWAASWSAPRLMSHAAS